MDTPSGSAPSSAPSAPAAPSTPSAPSPVSAKAPPQADVYKGSEVTTPDSPAASETKSEEKKRRLLSLKVDGKEEQVDLDGMSDEQVALELQMAKAARKRMQESAELKKQVQGFIEALKKDPISALKDPAFGVDVRKLVEDQLIEEYNLNQLPEHEKKLREQEKKLKDYETREQERTRQEQEIARSKNMEELKAKTLNQIETDFSAALEAKNLPKTRETMAAMAEISAMYLEKYNTTLTPGQLASEVEARIESQAKYLTAKMSPEALVKYLGKDVVDGLIKHSIESYRAGKSAPKAPNAPETPATPNSKFAEVKERKVLHSSLFDDADLNTDPDNSRATKKSNSFKAFTKLKRGF